MWWLVIACGGKLEETPEGSGETACDGKDDDGDGAVDEGLTQERYPDEDGDGYGVTNDMFTYDGCVNEEGWAAVNGDCDDKDELVNPDAEEICGDDVDDDCDGVPDACNELDSDYAVARYYGDGYALDGSGLAVVADADGTGGAGFVAIGVSEKGTDAVLAWSGVGTGRMYGGDAALPYDDVQRVAALDGGIAVGTEASGLGRVDVRFGPVTGASTGGFARVGDGAPEDVGFAVGGGDWLGEPSVAWAYDGESWGVGIDPLTLTGELSAADIATTVAIDSAPTAILPFPGTDGADDLLVVTGGATLFEGPFSGATALEDAAATFSTSSGGSASAVVADFDGDGASDVALGDPAYDVVTVWLAPTAGEHPAAEAEVRLDGPSGSQAGQQVSTADDLDGDGLPELLVYGPIAPGGVWIVTAPWKGNVTTDAAWRRLGDASASYGNGVTAGDLDNDGLPEVVLGGSDGAQGFLDLYLGSAIVAGP